MTKKNVWRIIMIVEDASYVLALESDGRFRVVL